MKTKEEIQYKKKLKEIEVQLKKLQTQFNNIRKRARDSKAKAISTDDAGKIAKIRKQLGL